MLKSTAPIQEEEEDPLAYYEKHTSQIEVGLVVVLVDFPFMD